MPPTMNVRIADLPRFKALLDAFAELARTLGKCENLPKPVMEASDQVRRELAALGTRDIGPPP